MTSRQMKRGSSAPQRQSNVRQSNYKREVGGRIDTVCQLMLLQGAFFFHSKRLTSSYSPHDKLGQYWSGEDSWTCADGRRAESRKEKTKALC